METIVIGKGTFNANTERVLYENPTICVSKDVNENYKILHSGYELYINKEDIEGDHEYLKYILRKNDMQEVYNFTIYHIIKNAEEYFDVLDVLSQVKQRGINEGYEQAKKEIRDFLGIVQ